MLGTAQGSVDPALPPGWGSIILSHPPMYNNMGLLLHINPTQGTGLAHMLGLEGALLVPQWGHWKTLAGLTSHSV